MGLKIAVFAGLTLLAANAWALSVTIQADAYIDSYNAGGTELYVTSCGGASNGLAVEGYDHPGDWIELKLVITHGGDYVDSLRSAGDDLAGAEHLVTVFGPGGVPLETTSSYTTMGMGIG